MTPPELRALLADSLALWGMAGRVAVAEEGVTLALAGGPSLAVRPARPEEGPVRWWLEQGGRRRPCTGVLGLLRALRHAGGDAGEDARRLRAAPGP